MVHVSVAYVTTPHQGLDQLLLGRLAEYTFKDWFKVCKYIFSYSNPYSSVFFSITIFRKIVPQILKVFNLLKCDSVKGYTDHARFSFKLHGFGFLAIYFHSTAFKHSVFSMILWSPFSAPATMAWSSANLTALISIPPTLTLSSSDCRFSFIIASA